MDIVVMESEKEIMNEQEHPLLAVSGMIEPLHGCEICHALQTDSELVEVEGIEYSQWKRVFPLYVCLKCTEKISDALKRVKEGKNE